MDNTANQIRRIDGMMSFNYQNYRTVNDDDAIRNEIVSVIEEDRSHSELVFDKDIITLYRNLMQFGDTEAYKLNNVANALLCFIKDDIQRTQMLTNTELLHLIKLREQ